MRLYEREPAARFDDAHLLGNGRLGASVYGGVPFEEILINDDTLWSGSERYRVNDEFYDCLMEARKLALAGDVKQANDLINDHMEGTWGQAYMPLTSALICVGQRDARRHMRARHVFHPRPGEIENYSRILDLDTAVETVSYARNGVSYRREYFVSHERQLREADRRGRGAGLLAVPRLPAEARRHRDRRRGHAARRRARLRRAGLQPRAPGPHLLRRGGFRRAALRGPRLDRRYGRQGLERPGPRVCERRLVRRDRHRRGHELRRV